MDLLGDCGHGFLHDVLSLGLIQAGLGGKLEDHLGVYFIELIPAFLVAPIRQATQQSVARWGGRITGHKALGLRLCRGLFRISSWKLCASPVAGQVDNGPWCKESTPVSGAETTSRPTRLIRFATRAPVL